MNEYEYNKLLLKQLKRSDISLENDDLPQNFINLLQRVSNAYNEAEQGRYIIERSMEISSEEMLNLREILQKEKEIMQSVMSEGLLVIDPFWKISNINVTGCKLLSSSCENLIGKSFYDVFTLYETKKDVQYKIELDELKAKCSEGKIYHCDNGALKTFTGILLPVRFSINPLPLINHSHFGGAVIILQDITKRLETEQVLLSSLQAAEQSNKAKTQFLANMSHEIRTPMNGVLGMLQLLMHTDLNEKQKNYIDKCYESANLLLRILGDILDFSKIEAGKVEVEEIDFKIKEVFESMLAIFKAQCREKSIDISMDFDPQIPLMVSGDIFRMKQIVTNLINNAIKFTDHNGEIHIDVKKIREQDEQITLSFSITDNGIGIPKVMQDKIFEIFSQADESTTRKHGGTGLGLAICKHLVELLGGEIHVTSEVNEGSTFVFTLKFKKIEKIQEHAVTTEAKFIIPQFNANILLVEDNPLNQKVVNDMLNTLGCKIDIVDTGKAAVNAYQQQKYDLIFMDCHMPEMDGFDATKKIREIENEKAINAKTVIVALTANALKGTKDKCLAVGMNDYLSKPVNYSQLCMTLIKHLPNLQGPSH
ncbi:ATP-binding protein [Candidatus Berkiella aquae]|uniref:Sensory/regulatory protein RpfC n=1 Tax=Candidatus Berkiella aquae TaxID=295108 RepID=A0A0Q9YTV8_9GAMM|nr:ATP-binding protein [Candidatus Berkiella aquae]MCS5711178.1 response regulator [Candidatus Berkiella aquae]